jgi:hypothetical protein
MHLYLTMLGATYPVLLHTQVTTTQPSTSKGGGDLPGGICLVAHTDGKSSSSSFIIIIVVVIVVVVVVVIITRLNQVLTASWRLDVHGCPHSLCRYGLLHLRVEDGDRVEREQAHELQHVDGLPPGRASGALS